MKRRSKAKNQPESKAAETASEPAPTSERRRRIIVDALKGLGFTLVIIAITVSFSHTARGKGLARLGYDYIQSLLSADEIPVAVVNISEVKPVPISAGGETRAVTPRPLLKSFLNEVAARGAKVIGVDINFAPLENGEFVSPAEDEEFFKFCLNMGKPNSAGRGVPVILGVDWRENSRAPVRRPELLIENAEYKELVAGIRIPRDAKGMPSEISDEQAGFHVVSFSKAIAEAYERLEPKAAHHAHILPEWMAEQFQEKALSQGVKAAEFLPDYNALKQLQSREYTLRTELPEVVKDQGDFLGGKIVLIGSGTLGKSPDIFPVPGQPQEQAPGVYLHAAAVHTLVKKPLYEMTWKGSILIDFLLSCVVIALITLIGLYYAGKTAREVARHRLEKIFTLLVGLAAMVFGVWFVNYHGVIWEDFAIVIPGLFLHSSIERALISLWGFLRRKGPAVVDSMVFGEDEEKHQ